MITIIKKAVPNAQPKISAILLEGADELLLPLFE